MRYLRWLAIPAALFVLTGYESRTLDRCLDETTIQCALDESAAVANSIEDVRQRASAFVYIARVQADIGQQAQARITVDKVLALKRSIMDPVFQDSLESGVARIHALLGEAERAIEIAQGIGEPARAALTNAWIAQAQAHAGDRAGARKSIARALESASDSSQEQLAYLFSQLAMAQAYMGDREETLAILDSALQLSDRFNSDLLKARTAAGAAVAESAVGETARAARSLERVQELRAEMEADHAPAKDMASVLAYLAWAQALVGDRDAALASIEPLKELIGSQLDPFSQSSQLAAVALVLAKAG